MMQCSCNNDMNSEKLVLSENETKCNTMENMRALRLVYSDTSISVLINFGIHIRWIIFKTYVRQFYFKTMQTFQNVLNF